MRQCKTQTGTSALRSVALWMVGAIVFGSTSAIGDGSVYKPYTVQAKVYYAKPPSGAGRLGFNIQGNEIVQGSAARLGVGISEPCEIGFSDTVLRIDNGEIAWFRRAAQPALKGEPEPNADQAIKLYEPTLKTPALKKASMEMKQLVPYFERKPDDSFAYTGRKFSGCSFNWTITPEQDTKYVAVEWKGTVEWVVRREQIPGVRLDIGKPTIESATTIQRARVRLKAWTAFVYPTADGGLILNLTRVTQDNGEEP